MLTVPEIRAFKGKRKLSMITCYDASFARILADSPIDLLLVGDSSSTVMMGEQNTLAATPESMVFFTQSVAKGTNGKKMIVADMPFLSTRKSRDFAVEIAGQLMTSGAHAVKIEGIRGHEDLIRHLVESGIPVMGHLGLTPQMIHAFGGMKVQGKSPEAQELILNDARRFQDCGAFALVLECIPSLLAAEITARLSIPTIGIGAGSSTDGQVLVLQDLLGFTPDFKPKFLRTYLEGERLFRGAFAAFHEDTLSGAYPNEKESYT